MALRVYDTDEKTKYVQPILVLKNGYQSKLINEWDGSLKVDANNNTILSSLIGAGKKDDNNLFTGVILGVANNFNLGARTGLYGYQNGEVRFALDENGAFFVGKGNDNFISFNEGVAGRASSGELLIKTQKFILNAGKLSINSTVSGDNAVIDFDNKFILRASGAATIGGWTIENNRIENIKTEDKRFYINANPTSGTYDSWIAAGKYDSTNKKWNWPFYVDKNGILYASGADIEGKFNINNESILNGTEVSKINSTTITSTPDSIALRAFEQKTTINGVTQTLNAHLQLNADNINAKVSKIIDISNQETMSWNLTSGSFTVKANGTQVMKVDKDGLTITGDGTFSGNISAATGTFKGGLYVNSTNYWNYGTLGTKIAGWTFGTNSITNGNTTLSSSSENYGISTSSIEVTGGKLTVGKGFKVNSSGTCEISNSVGFISMGISNSNNKNYHPYVSGLNIATGGIALRNVDSIDDDLELYVSSLTINSSGYNGVITSYQNLNINGGTNMALDSNGYLRIDANNTSRGTTSDPWSSWTASDSLYLTAGGNINIRSMGDIYIAPYGRDLLIGTLKTENNKTTFEYYSGYTGHIQNVGYFKHGIYIGSSDTPI